MKSPDTNNGGNGNAGRWPDYIVKIGLRGERYHCRVGAAWKVRNGGIALKVDPGLALVSGTDVLISLWPNEERPTNHSEERYEPATD